jgi:YHS domain-containing protein
LILSVDELGLGGGSLSVLSVLSVFSCGGSMDPVKDPVCGMTVEPDKALRMTYNAHDYYFCSVSCSRAFQADPARYAEQHDPPYTVSGGIAAPRFGSAGSGGLENEPAPEFRRKR